MSIDFDSAALQTQQDEEEEYDQEDYAREQELHKLLTDLPDDMLEDSRDSSSPDLDDSTCSNKNPDGSPITTWTQKWSDLPRQTSHEQNYDADYDPNPDEFSYGNGEVQVNGQLHHHHVQPAPHAWDQRSPDRRFTHGGVGVEENAKTPDFSTEEPYDPERRDCDDDREQCSPRNHLQCGDQYQASYNPHRPAHHAFYSQAATQDQHFDHLQRDFLDSTQQTVEKEQLAQLQILNKAQKRQIEDLEQKLEDSRRTVRYLEHQFAITKDEKDGLAASLKESRRLVEDAKSREVKMQSKLKAVEQQMQALNERDKENTAKQRVAEAAVDTMKQQMLDLCRSDTLSRCREQHDRDLAVLKEQHGAALLAVQQKLDSASHTLNDQTDVLVRLREQVKQLERQREEDQLERARVVNGLAQRLEESQQQCAKLLQTSSVQDMSQMQIRLQQAESAKALSDDMNKVLQEDLSDLKEQITLYESAVKHGIMSLDVSSDWENHLSESCMDLGLKKSVWKNGGIPSVALADPTDSEPSRDEALRLLRAEMQRCLGNLKGKRQKISRLQEELHQSQAQVSELQAQLDESRLRSVVRETSQTGEVQEELLRLQEEKKCLQEQAEALEKKMKELKQNEEKVRAANLELCTKMREMIQEVDQEKQEAAERAERIHQQHRDDLVSRVRTELMLEHGSQVEQLAARHEQDVQRLRARLSEADDKILAVQECYISVCKEKDLLEESIRSREKEEALMEENKVKNRAQEEELRAELEAQHRASICQLQALWTKDKEEAIQQQVRSHLASAEAAWNQERQQMEKTWTQRLEEAGKVRQTKMAESSSQTDGPEANGGTVTARELDAKLLAQKQLLQLEADRVRRKAVEDARKRVQVEIHEKHLEEIAKQVEGALSRAYSRWLEDLTSLPEYQAALQKEKQEWEDLQKKDTERRAAQAPRAVEEQRHGEGRPSGAERLEELQEEVANLQSRLERVRREQEALLKAELAGAKAAWNRDKLQEISMMQARGEQLHQSELQEQREKMEEVLLRAREDAELQRKELLLQTEAKLQQSLTAREEERAEKMEAQRRQMKIDFLAELQAGLADVQAQLLKDPKMRSGEEQRSMITRLLHTSCKDLVQRAVSQARSEWKKIGEEKLSLVLKETQELHQREILKFQSSWAEREQHPCRKECSETAARLHKKNQELRRNLEKACRQLQHSVREHKAEIQNLKGEQEKRLQKATVEHLQQLEEAKAKLRDSSGTSRQDQCLMEMKEQYETTVEKIRGDMLRYIQESRERAAEMIRKEVLRERQDTARKMRHHFLTCLQELLEDRGDETGAERKILTVASKLASMAKVLDTPGKSQSGGSGEPCRSELAGRVCLPPSPAVLKRGKADPAVEAPAPDRPFDSAPAGAGTPAPAGRTSTTAPRGKRPSQTAGTGPRAGSHLQRLASASDPAARPKNAPELPIREEKLPDWSRSSSDSDFGFTLPCPSSSGRKVEPVKPFSASAANLGGLGRLSPDTSDITVYNEISRATPRPLLASSLPEAGLSVRREPPSGSEGRRPLSHSSRTLFSELRQKRQDVGSHSPFDQNP